jgi:type 1 fimbria pilin
VDHECGYNHSPPHDTGRIVGPIPFRSRHGRSLGGIRKIIMRHLALILLLTAAALAAAPGKQTFTGTITDDMCGKADHSQMRMGPTDAECTVACVSAHGALYVLYDGKNIYTLSDQQTPEKFAGRRVKVIGTLDNKTKTIQVDSIAAAK